MSLHDWHELEWPKYVVFVAHLAEYHCGVRNMFESQETNRSSTRLEQRNLRQQSWQCLPPGRSGSLDHTLLKIAFIVGHLELLVLFRLFYRLGRGEIDIDVESRRALHHRRTEHSAPLLDNTCSDHVEAENLRECFMLVRTVTPCAEDEVGEGAY